MLCTAQWLCGHGVMYNSHVLFITLIDSMASSQRCMHIVMHAIANLDIIKILVLAEFKVHQ